MAKRKEPWFAIRKELSSRQQALLTAASFLIPILVWCAFSYSPFLWHPDIKLQLSASRENVTTVYTEGDHLSKEFFPTFVADVEAENQTILDQRAQGQVPKNSSRSNKKILRYIAPIGIANGWLAEDQGKDDDAIFNIWKGLANGTLQSTKFDISPANQTIIQQNWSTLQATNPVYDSKKFSTDALLKLIPQGKPANPVYLPAPHEVIGEGWKIWTRPNLTEGPSMSERYVHSLKIVFAGFLLSALIGVPLGILCGTFDFFSKLFEPFIDFFRYMPAPAFSTLLVAVLMAYDAPKIGLVFLGTFFQMVLIVSKTTQGLDLSLLEAAQTLGAKKKQLISKVIFPGILPDLYNDMRILLGWAWTWLVIAELVGVKTGLTEFIETQGRWRNFDQVFPVIITIGLTGFFTDQILASLRGLFFPWKDENSHKKANLLVRGIRWLTNRNVSV